MKQFSVLFSREYVIEAEDKDEAEQKAWDLFADDMILLGSNSDDFNIATEEI